MDSKGTIYIASDHAGFALKAELTTAITELGYHVEDLGAHTFDAEDDYPDYIVPLAQNVASEQGAMGVVLGGSGQGEAMAANRVAGVRAAVFYGGVLAQGEIQAEGTAATDPLDIVRLPRMHQDANILSIGARFVSRDDAVEAVRVFLETPFTGERHMRRIAKF